MGCLPSSDSNIFLQQRMDEWISQVVRAGGNVTHILNIKISNQPTAIIGTKIRQRIFNLINNVPITKKIYGMPVTITWRSNATTSSSYYHADVLMFTDLVVKSHTKMLLLDLLGMLYVHLYPTRIPKIFTKKLVNLENFTTQTTGLALIVTKPLAREVALVYDDINIEDELDVSEEQI